MRALLMTGLFVVIALAGCVDDGLADDATNAVSVVPAWIPGPGSHPGYGLPVRGDLPLAGEAPEGWPEYWVQPPAIPLPERIESLVNGGSVSGVESGSGITVFGSLAFVASWQTPDLWSIDISDLNDPRVISHFDETTGGDLETIAFPPTPDNPDGRLLLTLSTRRADIHVVDVTDPANMWMVTSLQPPEGNHNHQVIPGTPIVVNAASSGDGGSNSMFDLSDPENPAQIDGGLANGYGCHAVDFYINSTEEKYLGFCAGIEVTQVLDVTNPTEPEIMSTMPFPILNQQTDVSGAGAPASFSHLAMGNHDGTVLIMGDETGGGAAPGCDIHARDPITGTAATGPLGNLYFYDITDPYNPDLRGAVSPSAYDQWGSCTAHFGGTIEDRNQLVMAYYTVGVVLVDFSDLDNPYIQDMSGRNEGDQPCTLCGVWDAQYYRGAVLTGDISYGMEIMTFA